MKVTETFVLFQPLALAAGLARPLMTGAVLSILIRVDARGVVGVAGLVDAVAVAGDGLCRASRR